MPRPLWHLRPWFKAIGRSISPGAPGLNIERLPVPASSMALPGIRPHESPEHSARSRSSVLWAPRDTTWPAATRFAQVDRLLSDAINSGPKQWAPVVQRQSGEDVVCTKRAAYSPDSAHLLSRGQRFWAPSFASYVITLLPPFKLSESVSTHVNPRSAWIRL